MTRFVEWDSLELRVSGEQIEQMVRAAVAGRSELERLRLVFQNGVLRVEGVVRKFLAVPFSVEIHELPVEGMRVRVPLVGAAAFGAIPIPQFLFRLVKDKLPRNLVTFEEPSTFVVSLESFLPGFLSVELRKIWIIDGGLAVSLGRGGADLPNPIGDL